MTLGSGIAVVAIWTAIAFISRNDKHDMDFITAVGLLATVTIAALGTIKS